MGLKIKICGLREPANMIEVANLKPDLVGFNFYPDSPRYALKNLKPEIFVHFPPGLKKVGVFVNADLNEIKENVLKYSLDMVQLHGDETPETCRLLFMKGISLIKAFRIQFKTDFKRFVDYVPWTNYFLFDTPTKKFGGSGKKFDWKILEGYDLGQPFFLSGGIAPGDSLSLLEISNPFFYGIDINSRFEILPGKKDIDLLKKFMNEIRHKKT